jgi:molybdenum cofactor biosynthesis protein B
MTDAAPTAAPAGSGRPGGRIDEAAPFHPVRIAVLSVSDTRDEESDTSGDVLVGRIESAGHRVAARGIVVDDIGSIQTQIKHWIAERNCEVIITTGGTGLTGRDVTPEAVEPLFDKRLDGFSVIFHQISYQSVGLSTLQSRATAGLIGGVFVFCLPGSNGAVKDGWSVIAPQLDSRHRPCNLVELMPRLLER